MKSLNIDEITSLLEELETNGDIVIGLPEVNELSDGDSHKSDEEAEGTIDHLSRLVLSAPAEIAQEEEDDDEFTVEQPKSKKKRLRKGIQKDHQASDIE